MTGLTYAKAGVDIDSGNTLVNNIKGIAQRTHSSRVLQGIGGFSALYALPVERYRQPVMVSSTDGVGTKLKLAIESNRHQSIGIDLVAMCVNDLICCGAEPLFFLDYYATGKLNVSQAEQVIASIADGCEQANLSLIGGETAEMPGMYREGDYDLAGFCVGIVERDHIIDGHSIKVGDQLVAIASSGCHSTGYSLIRKCIEKDPAALKSPMGEQTLLEQLMTPTKIYVKALQPLIRDQQLLAASHITGGGLPENLPRMLPKQASAEIDLKSWQWPEIFNWIQNTGDVATDEMLRTFNCGVGMVTCVAQENLETVLGFLQQQGHQAWRIGEIIPRQQESLVMKS